MLDVAYGLWNEALRLPSLAYTTGMARLHEQMRNAPFSTKRDDVEIYIDGGAFADPSFSYPLMHHLEETLLQAPTIHPPHGILRHINDLEKYQERSYTTAQQNPHRKRIRCGYSLGGIPALIDLVEHPDDVLGVILTATPLQVDCVSRQIRTSFIEGILGINVRYLPPRLETLKMIYTDPLILRKIFVLTSMGDHLFPPAACIIPGAAYELLESQRHIDFMTSREVFNHTTRIIAGLMPRLHVYRDKETSRARAAA
jgi:hypothetical protein